MPLDLYGWRSRFKEDGLTPALRLELRAILSAKVVLREPILKEGKGEGEIADPSRVSDIVAWDIVLSANHARSALEGIAGDARWREALPELLTDATDLLHDAFDLMHELGGVSSTSDLSYLHQPSISEHAQNRGFRDWTVLVELARDAWVATAERSPKRALLEAERWWAVRYPLFKRLVFFAATHGQLFPPKQILDWLLSEDCWWLWSIETQRECLQLLSSLAPRLDLEGMLRLEVAILAGPPRSLYRDDVGAEELQQAFERQIWLRLAKCARAGAALGATAEHTLHALSAKYPDWKLRDDDRDEFPLWMETGSQWRSIVPSPRHRRELVEWLKQHPSADYWQDDDWSQRCRDNFSTTASALIALAREGVWLEDRWRDALQAWASAESLVSRSWRYMAPILNKADEKTLISLAHAVTFWLEAVAKQFDKHKAIFFELVYRVVYLYDSEEIELDRDPMFTAINHPVGQSTEAALRWWFRQALVDKQGLPSEVRVLFTDLCDTQVAGRRHGRLLLAAHVIVLFRVDPDWASQHLLPLFDWRRSVLEARLAWGSFLWSPRLYRPLLEVIKDSFLATADHYADLGDARENYAALLTFAALELGDPFSDDELATATQALPPLGLASAADALVRALEGAGEQRSEYWKNRVLPYINAIWPKSSDILTPQISEAFARLCIAAREVFPQALTELKYWLETLDQPEFVVYLLREAKLPEQYPEPALAFLDTVIGSGTQWPPTNLGDCLDTIQRAQPALAHDERYQRLQRLREMHRQA